MSDNPYLDNPYLTEIDAPNKISPFQGLLDKVAKSISPQQIGYEIAGGTAPGDIGLGLGAMATGRPFSSGMNIAAQAEGMRKKAVGGNVLLDIATDPLTYGALGMAGPKIGRAAEHIFRPSKVFGEKLAQKSGTVDFLPKIMEAMRDPVAGKVIEKSKVLEKFGGTTLGKGGSVSEKLSNLSAKDSQNVINALKDEVTLAVKENRLKPKQLEIGKLFGDLSRAQNEAFKGMKGAKFAYGLGKNIQKGIKGVAGTALVGGGFESGRRIAGDTLKKVFGL